MIFYCIYDSVSGVAFSFGSIITDELPAGFAITQLSEADTQMIIDGSGMWDEISRSVVPTPVAEPLFLDEVTGV